MNIKDLDGKVLWKSRHSLKRSLEDAVKARVVLFRADLRNKNLDGVRLPLADMREADFSGSDAKGADFHSSQLDRANFTNCFLERSNFRACRMAGSRLEAASLRQALFIGADLQNSVFTYADLSEADFGSADLRGADLSYSTLWQAKLLHAQTRGRRSLSKFTSWRPGSLGPSARETARASLSARTAAYILKPAAYGKRRGVRKSHSPDSWAKPLSPGLSFLDQVVRGVECGHGARG